MVKKNEENLPEVVRDQVPVFLQQGGGRGKENISKDDLTLPRIKLLQPLSPEVALKDAKPGTMVNSVTEKNYGTELKFIVINHFKSRIYWRDRDNGGGIACSALDAMRPRTLNGKIDDGSTSIDMPTSCLNCLLKEWDNNPESINRAPKCTAYYNFPIIIDGDTSPVILSMERTKVKAARKLLSLAAYSGGNYDMFARKYKLTVTREKKNDVAWFSYDVKAEGFVNEEEYKQAEAVYNSLKNVIVQVDAEQPEEIK
jgi:hypothetical protein